MNFEDVKMRLFALSLEADAFEWFSKLDDDSIKTFTEFETAFNSRWGDKKENRHLLAALTKTKKKENETIEEFNKKFNDLVSRLHKDIKPLDASILIYYIEAFEGEMRYQRRDKEPTTLQGAMQTIEKIDKNMQASGKSNLPGFSRNSVSISKSHYSKGKAVEPEGKDQTKESIKEITELMK